MGLLRKSVPGLSLGQGIGAFDLILNDNLEDEFNRDEEVRAQLTDLAQIAVEYAHNLAAKDTNAMADSIRFVGFEIVDGQLAARIEVGDGAEYWVFVEYGTGQAGAGSNQPEPGLPDGYTHGQSSGVIARPFMRPTITYLKSRIGD